MAWTRLRLRPSRSLCSTASISGARGTFPPFALPHAVRNASAAARRQKKHGRSPGGERHRFVEKEKLGPAAAAHHLPVPPLVVENTNETRLGRPAPAEQRFGCRVVDDPAVTDEKASLRDRNDIAKRGHPVLQGSPTAPHQPLPLSGGLRRTSIANSPSG